MQTPAIILNKKFVFAVLSVVLVLLVSLTEYLYHLECKNYLTGKKQRLHSTASLVRVRLEEEINTSLNLSMGVVVYVSQNPNLDQKEFENIARILLTNAPHIRNIGLAKNNIITHMYPLEGNRKALGFRYLENPSQAEPVKRAIRTGKTVIAGPVNLIQGGQAFIARIPIYHSNKEYWGIASVVMDIDSLYRVSGLQRYDNQIHFALKGQDARGTAGRVFMGDPALFSNTESVTLRVHLPQGEWILAAQPVANYGHSRMAWLIRIVGHSSTVIFILLLYWLYSSFETIRHLALHDTLTGLANRRLLYEHMDVCKRTMSRTGKGFALLYIDIDGFKPVNDTHGHQAGDMVLETIASRIKSSIRPGDIPSRVGGDEFVILLREAGDPESIRKKAMRIEEVLSESINLTETTRVTIGASIGIALFPQDGEDLDNLMLKADQDMYRVKVTHKQMPASH